MYFHFGHSWWCSKHGKSYCLHFKFVRFLLSEVYIEHILLSNPVFLLCSDEVPACFWDEKFLISWYVGLIWSCLWSLNHFVQWEYSRKDSPVMWKQDKHPSHIWLISKKILIIIIIPKLYRTHLGSGPISHLLTSLSLVRRQRWKMIWPVQVRRAISTSPAALVDFLDQDYHYKSIST